MLHLSKWAVLEKNTNNNKKKIQRLWILEFYSFPSKFTKFVILDSRVVRVSGIWVFKLLLYLDDFQAPKAKTNCNLLHSCIGQKVNNDMSSITYQMSPLKNVNEVNSIVQQCKCKDHRFLSFVCKQRKISH